MIQLELYLSFVTNEKFPQSIDKESYKNHIKKILDKYDVSAMMFKTQNYEKETLIVVVYLTEEQVSELDKILISDIYTVDWKKEIFTRY